MDGQGSEMSMGKVDVIPQKVDLSTSLYILKLWSAVTF